MVTGEMIYQLAKLAYMLGFTSCGSLDESMAKHEFDILEGPFDFVTAHTHSDTALLDEQGRWHNRGLMMIIRDGHVQFIGYLRYSSTLAQTVEPILTHIYLGEESPLLQKMKRRARSQYGQEFSATLLAVQTMLQQRQLQLV